MWTWVSWYQTSASMFLFWEMSEWWENVSILDFIVAKWWSYKTCKAPVKLSPSTNQHPAFYRPDALPVTQPTVSKHWRNILFQIQMCIVTILLSFNFCLTVVLQTTPRWAVPLQEPLGTAGADFLEAGCPSYYPINSHFHHTYTAKYDHLQL